MKLLSLLLLVGALTACEPKAPVSSAQSNNPNYPVDLLFEHDGCKVYRFYDNIVGTVIYTNCRGQTSHHPDKQSMKTVTTSEDET